MRKGSGLGIRLLAFLLVLLLPRPAFAATGTQAVKLGKNVSGALTETYPERRYTFTLPRSGRVALHATSATERVNYRLYTPSGDLVFRKEGVQRDEATGKSRIDETIDLQGGTYTLCVDSKYLLVQKYYGKFVFRINYKAAAETFAETNKAEKEDISSANAVSFGQTIRAQMSANEDRDIFRFRLSAAGRVSLRAKAQVKYLWYNLYDANGKEIWTKHAVWNSGIGTSYVEENLDLLPGTYYFAAAKDRSTGTYAFRLAFRKVAVVSFAETAGKNNDTLETAMKISVGKTVRGFLALTNEKDFYRFKVASGKEVRVQAAAYMKYISYKIINSRGETVWSAQPNWGSASGKSRIDEKVKLSKGTYYFLAQRVGTNTGRYLFCVG